MSHRPAPVPPASGPPPVSPPPPPPPPTHMEPLILMSGFLTKRTKTMKRWKKRWWQLLGDGNLLYFKGEARVRVLGEVDVAHTCYDIRLGAQHCLVHFPRTVNPSACLSFAVLKRTYYVYAPSSFEARQWADALTNSSYLLNQNRPHSLSSSPALQVARTVRSTNPLPAHTNPSPPDASLEEEKEFEAYASEQGGYARLHSSSGCKTTAGTGVSSNLWIDGSPQVKHGPHPRFREAPGRPTLRHRAMSQSTLVSPASEYTLPNSRHLSLSQTALSHPSWGGFHEDELEQIPELGEVWEGQVSTLPSLKRLQRHQLLNTHNASWNASCEKLELLQRKEDAIRLRLEQLKGQSDLFNNPTRRGVHVLPPLEDLETSLSQPSYTTGSHHTTTSSNHFQHSPTRQEPSSPALTTDHPLSSHLRSSRPRAVRRFTNKKKVMERQKTPAAYVEIGMLPEICKAEVKEVEVEEEEPHGYEFNPPPPPPPLPPPPPPPPPPPAYNLLQLDEERMQRGLDIDEMPHEEEEEEEEEEEVVTTERIIPRQTMASEFGGLGGQKSSVAKAEDANTWVQSEIRKVGSCITSRCAPSLV